MKKNIAVVAGGYSGEYAISIQSAETICGHIDADKYDIYKIIIDRSDWKDEKTGQSIDKNDFTLTVDHQKIHFDLVFIGIHGTPGEDGKLQGYFDMLGIPYTSCNAVSSALTFNKVFCNKVVEGTEGVYVAKSKHLYKHLNYTADEILKDISLPVFVKPAEGGSSLATFKVKDEADVLPSVLAAFEVDHQVMAEEFIEGRELTIGVFTKQGEIIALPITEIISTKEFFDYEAKYTPGVTNEVTPADLQDEVAQRIRAIAKRLYHKLYCRGIVRFDFIYNPTKDLIYFLEVNTMPGQSQNSIVPQQVRAAGMTLREFYDAIITESL